MRARSGALAAALVTLPLAACGSGAQTTADGTPIVSWYIANEAFLDPVVEACNSQAGGAYQIVPEVLPTTPDLQREQLVRRLAAEDSSIDLIGMDVIWTAEFARAGWVQPFEEGELEHVGDPEAVFTGPYESSLYEGRQYGAPLNSNTRLLWYRESRLGDTPVPATWDELFDTAEQLGSPIQETGIRAESLVVLFNALVESAGTSIVEVDEQGESQVVLEREPTLRALEILQRLGQAPAAPAGQVNLGEDQNRLAFQSPDSTSTFMINWPFVFPSVLSADPELAEDYGVAPFPRVDPDVPAAAALGGFNLAVGAFTDNREAALAAINCLTAPEQQRIVSTVGGQPPTLRELAEDPEITEALPFLPLLTEQLETAAPRPVTPQYNDVSLAVRTVLHPISDITDTEQTYEALRDLLERALDSQAVL